MPFVVAFPVLVSRGHNVWWRECQAIQKAGYSRFPWGLCQGKCKQPTINLALPWHHSHFLIWGTHHLNFQNQRSWIMVFEKTWLWHWTKNDTIFQDYRERKYKNTETIWWLKFRRLQDLLYYLRESMWSVGVLLGWFSHSVVFDFLWPHGL